MAARKSLGQHFLMHPRIAERIVNVAKLAPGSVVLEIGPGKGILTRELLKNARKVIAVELDRRLYDQLQETFRAEIGKGGLELLCRDIRTLDTKTLPKGYALVANIPYYITGEIVRAFLTTTNQPSAMTLLVQKEVAVRIARSKKESILSLSVKAYGVPKYEFTVPRGAFLPAPNVDSAVLTIRDISRKHFKTSAEEKRFFDLIHAGFAHKRKFANSNLAHFDLPPGVIPDKARAEDLPLDVWLSLAKNVHQRGRV